MYVWQTVPVNNIFAFSEQSLVEIIDVCLENCASYNIFAFSEHVIGVWKQTDNFMDRLVYDYT